MRLLTILFFIFTFSSYAAEYDPTAKTLTYNGEINSKLLSLLGNSKDIRYLKITSTGGYVDIKNQVINLLNNAEIGVIVDGECLSACADIFILSKGDKFIIQNSKLGFHSSSLIVSTNKKEYINQLLKKKYTYTDMKFMYEEALIDNRKLFTALINYGVPPEFVISIMDKFGSNFVYMTAIEVEKYNIATIIN